MSKSGLASLSQGRSDLLRVDPRQLHIKDNWNSRDLNDPANVEHIEALALSIAEIGVKKPLVVYWDKDKAYVSDGHCRLKATLLAISRGAEIKTVPVLGDDRYANEADRIFGQIVHNSGKPFTPLEQANVFKRLVDLGWQQGDIAKRAGISASRVSQVLDLLTLPEGVKAMVVAGNVSATMAVATVKAEGGTVAEQALKNGLALAKAEGRTKVKSAHIEGTERKQNVKSVIKDALEHSDIDDSMEELVIIKLPNDKWEAVRKALDW